MSEPTRTEPAPPLRLAIVGTGLMGTSIGLALQNVVPAHSIVGWDPDAKSLAHAFQRGAIHRTATGLADAVANADLVVIAAPVDHVAAVASDVQHAAPGHCVVTDIASTKQRIVRECEAILDGRFVGGHPMAGGELAGPQYARADMLKDAPWVLTPTAQTSPRALATVEALIRAVGARPVRMVPDEHDRAAAFLSHLPHVMAFALFAVSASNLSPDELRLAAGSFRSATRVAGADPHAWASILADNADYALEAIELLLGRLTAVRTALRAADRAALGHLLEEGRTR